MRLRQTFVLFACLAAALLFAGETPRPLQAAAMNEEDEGEVRRLRQTVQRLQGEVAERNQKINQLQAQVRRMRDRPDPDDARIRRLQQQLREKEDRIDRLTADLRKARSGPGGTKEKDKELEELRKSAKDLEVVKEARYVHTVILRLKKGAPDREVKALLEGAPRALGKVAGVRGVWVGKPAAVASDKAQTDYQVGLVVLFDDEAAMRRFLNNADQKRFTEGLKKSWETAAVYDFLP
jgi:TolA-binding protein